MGWAVVAVLLLVLLLGPELVCLGLLALLRFRAAGIVLILSLIHIFSSEPTTK